MTCGCLAEIVGSETLLQDDDLQVAEPRTFHLVKYLTSTYTLHTRVSIEF